MKKLCKALFFGGALLTWLGLGLWALMGDDLGRLLRERQAEVVGAIADRYVASQSRPDAPDTKVRTVSGLHHIPIQVERIRDDIFRASGVGNSFMVRTAAGNVLFDSGLGTQAAKQKRLLQEAVPGDLKYIIISHSHADHLGATKYWKAEYPEANIVTHRLFAEGQRYLKALEPYYWHRNRLLYPSMPVESPDDDAMFAYGGIVPDITVADGDEFRFELGGVEFLVLPTPGAEGEDSIVLWLPQERALFSGDVFGPLFPMVPNLFTLRGDKFRDPVRYLQSLDTLIALQPDIVLPGHFDPVEGREDLVRDMTLMREATRYIHDETVRGMNEGRSVWQLMEAIELPPELAISQGHGKVSWDVRSIWEHYSSWFHFESTTELYPVPIRSLYGEIAAMSPNQGAWLDRAGDRLAAGEPVAALHFIEIALAGTPDSRRALELQLQALEELLRRNRETTGNFSEAGWLSARIDATRQAMAHQ